MGNGDGMLVLERPSSRAMTPLTPRDKDGKAMVTFERTAGAKGTVIFDSGVCKMPLRVGAGAGGQSPKASHMAAACRPWTLNPRRLNPKRRDG